MESWDRSRTRLVSWAINSLRVIYSLGVALLVTFIWFQACNRRGVRLPDGVNDVAGTAIMVIAGIFAFAGSLILDRAWKRSQDMARAILLYDKQGFMLLRDEKIPNILVIALYFFAFWILVLLGLSKFPSALAGEVVIFATASCVALYFWALHNLLNPQTSVWFARRTPKAWLDEDSDSYFKSPIPTANPAS